jgi:hypothetical protein
MVQFYALNSFLDTAEYPFFGGHVLYDLLAVSLKRESGINGFVSGSRMEEQREISESYVVSLLVYYQLIPLPFQMRFRNPRSRQHPSAHGSMRFGGEHVYRKG